MMFYSIGKSIKNFIRVKIFLNETAQGKSGRSHSESDDLKAETYRKWYYRDGSLKAEVLVRNGKMEGIANLYYESGSIKAREFYRDDMLQGLSKWYYETGELKSEKYYKDGILASIKEFDKFGRVIKDLK